MKKFDEYESPNCERVASRLNVNGVYVDGRNWNRWTTYHVVPLVLMAIPSKSAPPVNGLGGAAFGPSLKLLIQQRSTTLVKPERSSASVASLRAFVPLTLESIVRWNETDNGELLVVTCVRNG